jgi:hypothetical protein
VYQEALGGPCGPGAEKTTAESRAAAIDRLLSRRDSSLRDKTLWRMLYETAARAAESSFSPSLSCGGAIAPTW